ncbi:phosphopantetheine-binding protein [uncultured Subdoligranulum sp.]|uniref:Acyl carrier protein n=1 Tax=Candidatus Gemmiger excrementavium TaxID=2838608 RepID=A0A9D2JEJ0_9FIRM|nr:phosphopantetheine-binding protein [uncultured Subdoligranulum sp.]HIZ47540.1 acyl carrier protein [Candidatus Gemmiger excrementavium]
MHTMEEILAILAQVKPGLAPAPDEELVRTGQLDSVEIMSLVMALAEEFDLEISPLDLKEENFHTAEAILALVNRLEE